MSMKGLSCKLTQGPATTKTHTELPGAYKKEEVKVDGGKKGRPEEVDPCVAVASKRWDGLFQVQTGMYSQPMEEAPNVISLTLC